MVHSHACEDKDVWRGILCFKAKSPVFPLSFDVCSNNILPSELIVSSQRVVFRLLTINCINIIYLGAVC